MIQAASVLNLTMITVDLTFVSITGLLVFTGTHRWGWPDFLGLEKLKDPSGGYVGGSSCVVKADLTIVGSSNDG